MPEPARPSAFISYSHKDDAWRRRLFPGDFVSTQAGDWLLWSDSRIRAGEVWNDEIQQHLLQSRVAILLASANFLHSDFIHDHELPRILERAERGEMRVVWIPIGDAKDSVAQLQPRLVRLQAALALDFALPEDARLGDNARIAELRDRIRLNLLDVLDEVAAALVPALPDRYKIKGVLGWGNRAMVYLAEDSLLSRKVAIKTPHDRDQQQRAAFMQDVRNGIPLSDEPNFLSVYDCGDEGANAPAYCVQQLLEDRRSLRKMLDEMAERDEPVPVERLYRIFTRLTGAIARAHDRGFTYGNLMPGNIVLNGDHEPFILPVGRPRGKRHDESRLRALLLRLARSAPDEAPISEADADELAYLVPDQFGDEVVDIDPEKVDQYMLGLLAWELATGERPRAVADPQRLPIERSAAFADLPPVRSRRPLIPRPLDRLLAKMTDREPHRRYDSLKQVMAELEEMPDIGLLIVLDSWSRIVAEPDFDPGFFERFYAAFWRTEGAGDHFGHLGPDRWQQLRQLLKQAVLLLLAFKQQGGAQAEHNVLSRIAESHRGIPPYLYDPFRDALILTVCGDPARGIEPADPVCRGSDRGHERTALRQQWTKALQPGIGWLKSRSGGA